MPNATLRQSFWTVTIRHRESWPQAVVLAVCFPTGLVSLPVFLHMILSGKQLVLGFNKLIDLERHVRGKLATFLCSRFTFTE
jgi:hypothetical protein